MGEKYETDISIIVPTYNVEKYITRCIRSIENQGIDNYEIVVVDDASNDSTVKILNRLSMGNHRIRFFRNNVNHGSGYTKNKALSLCKGKYICFVDSDDFLVPKALHEVYKIAENLQCDDVYYGMKSVDEGCENFLANSLPVCVKKIYDRGTDYFEELLDAHKVTTAAPHHFFRRDLLQVTVRFSEGIINDDWEFTAKLFPRLGKTVVLNNNYYIYFHRTVESITHLANKKCRIVEIYNLAVQIYEDLNCLGNDYANYRKKIFRHMMIELRDEIFNRKKGWENEWQFVEHMLGLNENQWKQYDKAKKQSRFGIINNEVVETAGRASNVYIYGAGAYGCDAYRVLTENGIEVSAFITTNGECRNSMGLPVLKLNEFTLPKDGYIIVAVSNKYKGEIESEIRKRNIRCYGNLLKP